MTETHGSISARVERYLAAIETHNDTVNAVLALTPDAARAAAREADTAVADGSGRGLLHGTAMLIKDCIDMAGMPTTHGTKVYGETPAQDDAEVIRKLRQGGAILMGKTHLPELCFGATGENPHFGNCRNPWDPARISGGSSSGSAAAVAAGFCDSALGTDTGGSVRVPAALCGVVGLRPTIGRVSNVGVLGVSTIADTVGPVARTVHDVARAYAQIAGFSRGDPLSLDSPVADCLSDLNAPIDGMRIGVPRQFFFDDVDPDVEAAVRAAADRLADLGAVLVPLDLADPETLKAHLSFQFVLADVADANRHLLERHRDAIGPQVLRRLELGTAMSAMDYARCIRALQRWRMELRDHFDRRIDILLTPTTPVTAPLWDDAEDMVATTRLVARFTYDIGAAGVPALTVPCGLDRSGLPIGLQLVAPWCAEARLLRVGAAYQNATDAHRNRPPLRAP